MKYTSVKRTDKCAILEKFNGAELFHGSRFGKFIINNDGNNFEGNQNVCIIVEII